MASHFAELRARTGKDFLQMCGIRPSWTCKAELGSEIEDGKGREKKPTTDCLI